MWVKLNNHTPHYLVSSTRLCPLISLGPVAGQVVYLSAFLDLPGMGCFAATWSHTETQRMNNFFKGVAQTLPLVSLVTVCQLTLRLAKFWGRWQQKKPNRSCQRRVVGGAWRGRLAPWSPWYSAQVWMRSRCTCPPASKTVVITGYGNKDTPSGRKKYIEAISWSQQVCQAAAPCPR